MGVTINVNNLSIVHTDSGGQAQATIPDVCLKKIGKDVVPIPFSNKAVSKDLDKGTKKVTADGGNSIAIDGSIYAKSEGDSGGDKKGVASGTIEKEAKFILCSGDVEAEGKGICRLTDKMTMNKANTACLSGTQNGEVEVDKPDEIQDPTEPNWLKIRARYDDLWKTAIPVGDVKVTVNGSAVAEGLKLKPGLEDNTQAWNLKEAESSKDEPGVAVVKDFPDGNVEVEFVKEEGLEKNIADARESLEILLDGAYRDTVDKMKEFQAQWDEYGYLSIVKSGSEGLYAGASAWLEDQADLLEWETWKEIGESIGDAADKALDYAADYAVESYEKVLKSANETVDWVEENADKLVSWSWWKKQVTETVDNTVDEAEQQFSDAVDFLKASKEKIEKLIEHKDAILNLPKLIAEGDVSQIEYFIDSTLMDIDPETAKTIKNDPNFYIVLELIADHDTVLTYFTYLSLFLEAIPPNFYAYLAGKGGSYVMLEILLAVVIGFLSAGAGTAARATLICARLASGGAKVAKVGKTIKKARAAIDAVSKTVQDFVDAMDILKELGEKLVKARNAGILRKAPRKGTMSHKKKQKKRDQRCRVCKSDEHTTQRAREPGCIVYK